MGAGPARWIALVAVLAAAAGLVVVLTGGGGGGEVAEDDAGGGRAAIEDRSEEAAVDGPHVLVELCTDVVCPAPDDAAQQALADELLADPRVASVRLVTADQAYELFLDRFGDDRELVEQVRPEDVPARIELDLYDVAAIGAVVADWGDRDVVARAADATAE